MVANKKLSSREAYAFVESLTPYVCAWIVDGVFLESEVSFI